MLNIISSSTLKVSLGVNGISELDHNFFELGQARGKAALTVCRITQTLD